MDRSDHYPFLASAVAGRHAPVRATPGTRALACSDGKSIMLPPAAQRAGRPAWQDVVAQAALIGAGSLEPQLLRGLIGRPEAARRYGYLEVLRAARLLAGRLPSAFLALPQIDCGYAPTQSAAESLRWALSNRPVPAPAEFFGCIRPMMVLRKSLSEEGLTALTRKVDFDKPRAAENGGIDDEDDQYESRYAEEDTRVALQEARSHGTAVVCLCVGGTQEVEKLRAVFGGANLLIVDEPEQVAGVIRRICWQALAGVSRRKFKPVSLSS